MYTSAWEIPTIKYRRMLKGKGIYCFIAGENNVNKVDHSGIPKGVMEKFYLTLSRIAITLEQDQFNLIHWS